MSAEDKGPDLRRGEISPEDREALRQRSTDIGRRLGEIEARRASVNPNAPRRPEGAAMGQAFRFAADLIAGVGVGGLIGWALDRQFGTTPWLLALFVILGFAAGLSNVIRLAKQMQAEAEASQLAAPSVKDDEDDR